MIGWKKALGIAATVVSVVVVGATFFTVTGTSSNDTVQIRLAHNQAKGSEIAASIAKISEFAAEDPRQNLEVAIYASGVLGTEKEEVEMVKAVVLISLPQVATGLRLRLPGSFRRRAFHADLLMPQGALLRRGRSDSSTPAKSEEDAVGNQCRIRQKGGIVLWLYFILQ